MLRTCRGATFVLLLSAACGPAPAASGDAERARLLERQQAFFDTLAAKEAEAMAALFAETAEMHVANMPPVEGRAAIEAFYQRMFGFLASSTATAETTELSERGDMAYSTGRTTNAFRSADGTVEYAGKFILVWRQLDGEWRVVLYGVSSNEPGDGR